MEVKRVFKNYVYPSAVFIGGVIGVGFLSLPYVAMKSGIWVMLAYFIVITALMAVVNLMFAEISIKTPDFKRFPGFVGFHLGKYAKALAILAVGLGTFGVLLAYLIVGGKFLTLAFQPVVGGNLLAYILIYFLAASCVVFFDIKVVSKAEFWVLLLLAISLIFVFLQAIPQMKLSRVYFDYSQGQLADFFLPYGAVLFSLWGIGIIPEIEEMLRQDKKRLKKIILYSTILISVLYFVFTVCVLAISGGSTAETALSGLEKFLGKQAFFLAMIAGASATFTAFVAQATVFKKVLIYDLKIKHWQSFVMTCFVPLILYLAGLNSFIGLISFTGGVLLGIDGILIILMYRKINKKNRLVYPMFLIFLLGIAYEIFYLNK